MKKRRKKKGNWDALVALMTKSISIKSIQCGGGGGGLSDWRLLIEIMPGWWWGCCHWEILSFLGNFLLSVSFNASLTSFQTESVLSAHSQRRRRLIGKVNSDEKKEWNFSLCSKLFTPLTLSVCHVSRAVFAGDSSFSSIAHTHNWCCCWSSSSSMSIRCWAKLKAISSFPKKCEQ